MMLKELVIMARPPLVEVDTDLPAVAA